MLRGLRGLVRERPALAAVTVAYFVAMERVGRRKQSRAVPAYAVMMPTAFAAVGAINRRSPLSGRVLWALSLWGLGHMAGGLIPTADGVLHNTWVVKPGLRYDQAVHTFGFGTSTVAVWQVLRRHLPEGTWISPGTASVVALAGMGVGALNEVIEFFVTRVDPQSNVGGYENTGWDLVYNTIGCGAAAVWLYKHQDRTARVGSVAAAAPG